MVQQWSVLEQFPLLYQLPGIDVKCVLLAMQLLVLWRNIIRKKSHPAQ